MIQPFLFALSALASITGIETSSSIATNRGDYEILADVLHTDVIEDGNSEFTLANVDYVGDLYALNGANQFLEIQLDNGYLIYDKLSKSVVEENYTVASPYNELEDSFKVYVPQNENPGYIYFDGEEFQVIAENNKSSHQAGDYPTNIVPKSDAVFVTNAHFFTNLWGGHGNNYDSICGVVSTEIILNYYDTFKNDKIVPEEYEIRATENTKSTKSLADFVNSPATGSNDSSDVDGQRFVEDLVDVCTSAIGHTPVGKGLYTTEQIEFAREYLNRTGVSYTMHTCEGNWADRIGNRTVSFIKNAIKAGRPVISNGTGHSTVAYGYDSDYVFVHTGWGYVAATPWSTFTTTMLDFKWDVGAIDIEINEHFHSDNYYSSHFDQYLCPCDVSLNHHVFTPDSYDFESQYFYERKTKTYTFDDEIITTNRLRCGYIENSFINLSARKQNAGEAYLQYELNTNVHKIVTHVSYWGTKEYFTTNAKIEIQYWDATESLWKLLYNLKDNISNDRAAQTELQLLFPKNTTIFRFYVSDYATGTYNRGRLSIGNTELIYL